MSTGSFKSTNLELNSFYSLSRMTSPLLVNTTKISPAAPIRNSKAISDFSHFSPTFKNFLPLVSYDFLKNLSNMSHLSILRVIQSTHHLWIQKAFNGFLIWFEHPSIHIPCHRLLSKTKPDCVISLLKTVNSFLVAIRIRSACLFRVIIATPSYPSWNLTIANG